IALVYSEIVISILKEERLKYFLSFDFYRFFFIHQFEHFLTLNEVEEAFALL
ncbi:unnamed protein product, partial [Larinioides sclopetarius]